MIDTLALWLVVGFPKQECVDKNKGRPAIVTIEGTTETFKTIYGHGQELAPKFSYAVADKEPAVTSDPCYDFVVKKVDEFRRPKVIDAAKRRLKR